MKTTITTMRTLALALFIAAATTAADAQGALKRVYDEALDPMTQIDEALAKASAGGKYVVCQVGGNWCPWCLRFADFAEKDTAVSKAIADNFVFIHVNYDPRKASAAKAQGNTASSNTANATAAATTAGGADKTAAMMKRLGNPARFGFPVFVVLDERGNVLHTQDSSFLEEGNGYSEKKVLRFLKNWTPKAVKPTDGNRR